MRTLPLTTLSIAIGAGFAATLLFASLIGGGALALPLFVLAPLPIAIAALGWGSVAGGLAVAVAVPALGFGLAWPAAIAFLLMVGLPITVASNGIRSAGCWSRSPPWWRSARSSAAGRSASCRPRSPARPRKRRGR
jgi:hypothetical protein